MLAYYPALILLLPLAAGLIIGLLGRTLGPKAGRIGVAAEVISFALSLLVLYEVTTRGPQTIHLSSWHDGILQFGLHIDRLSSVMLVHIAAISILIHLFSIRYMQQERGYTRFHSLLAFTGFVLFGMVSSANLLMLFIFWQLLSWLVPLLSHNYSHPLTVRGAFRTFVMQRIGDVAFLAAIVLAYRTYGSLDFQQLFLRAAEVQSSLFLGPGGSFEMRADTAVTLLIFIGAMTKSAQFPLHMWLPDSLYAPTPVHALLHAGIINAGGFLLTRLAPLYDLNPPTLHLVFAVGMLTTLLGSSMMLVQNDIKKTLGYSTIGQMGFMIMECGLGAYGLAIFHLIAHGLFKGTIFLNCGYVIHAARQEPRLPPKSEGIERSQFSTLTWLTGFLTTLILPLIILLAAHGILRIPLRDSQGTTIFLFFGWATSSQAILTLYRLRAVATWKVAMSMLFTLFLVVITYLLAAESFTHFLFPAPGQVAAHFQAGALPVLLFDVLVSAFALVIILGWILIYAESHGRTIGMPEWVNHLRVRIYLLLMNRLYLDALAIRFTQLFRREVDRLNASRVFPYVAALIAIGSALAFGARLPAQPAEIGLFILIAILLPLFPLHGIYVAALTRWPGYQAVALAMLLPAAGAVRDRSVDAGSSGRDSSCRERAGLIRRGVWIAQSFGSNESSATCGLRRRSFLFSSVVESRHYRKSGCSTNHLLGHDNIDFRRTAPCLAARTWTVRRFDFRRHARFGRADAPLCYRVFFVGYGGRRAASVWRFFRICGDVAAGFGYGFVGTDGDSIHLVLGIVVFVQNDAAASVWSAPLRYSL